MNNFIRDNKCNNEIHILRTIVLCFKNNKNNNNNNNNNNKEIKITKLKLELKVL
jgi:hypothetical protein